MMRTNATDQKMTWRKFQQDLQLESNRKNKRSKSHKRVGLFLFLIFVVLFGNILTPDLSSSIPGAMDRLVQYPIEIAHSVIQYAETFFSHPSNDDAAPTSNDGESDEKTRSRVHTVPSPLTIAHVKKIVDAHSHALLNTRSGQLTLEDEKERLFFDTTLDMNLQHFILSQIESVKQLNRGRPEIIAMVVMEPKTGKILAMAGFDNQNQNTNPCTQGQYPAASLFKMVTASAAVETCGFSPHTELYFNGGKYTLYKRQLKESKNKYSNKVTLANAFAESINPVFGKLGSFKLGGDILEAYATSFGFNQPIDCDISFAPGKIVVTDSSYQWAEVASGFNKTTTISPLFGAMLAATLLNDGKIPMPSIVKSVTNEDGQILYKHHPQVMGTPIQPKTAKAVMAMMNKTITKGTAKKYFRGLHKDETLSKLDIGGKTGSLYNREHTVKFDWFAGFCKEPHGKEQIVVSVVVGHGKYIGTRASRFSRRIFTEYFNNFFAANATGSNKG